jgi:hypothetical protein
MPDHTPITILGAGYVGSALLRSFPSAGATHRSPASQSRRFRFDLDDPSTWRNPPLVGRTVIWTFPATPPDRVRSFHDRYLRDARGLIVLGSTSAYLTAENDAVAEVDEHAPLDMTQPRVQGEEWLRTQGATVLQLAGIFGPGREPDGWLRRGRIRDGAKLVNLIHVDDIVAVIAHLVADPAPGERINVANGEPIAWRDLAARFRADGRIPADFALPESGPLEFGKRIDNRRLRELLPGHIFRTP